MSAVQLQRNGAAPGQTGHVRRPELKRPDERCKPVREARQGHSRGQVRGPASPWLVPGNDGELVGQHGELRLPDTAVLGRAVDKDQ